MEDSSYLWVLVCANGPHMKAIGQDFQHSLSERKIPDLLLTIFITFIQANVQMNPVVMTIVQCNKTVRKNLKLSETLQNAQ